VVNQRYHDIIQVMKTAAVIDESATDILIRSDREYRDSLAQTAVRLRRWTPWHHIYQTGKRSTSSGSTSDTRRGMYWCPSGGGRGTTPSDGWPNRPRRRCWRSREREFSS
jgi:hypothetical protein